MKDKKYVTVVAFNPNETADLSDQFIPDADKAYVREKSALFEMEQEFTADGLYRIHLKPTPTQTIIDGLTISEQQEKLLIHAIAAATTKDGKDLAKQSAMLSTLKEGQIQELLDNLEPVNPADRQGLMAIQQIVKQRLQLVTGMGFGDNYFDYDSDAFYSSGYTPFQGADSQSAFSFFNGAGWGQIIYGNSRHKAVDGSNGFTGTMSGFVVGADTELTNTLRLGAAGSWTRNKLSGDNNASVTVNNYMATFYGHWYSDGWYSDGIFSLGKGKSKSSQIVLNDSSITGQYTSNTLGVRLITGHKFGVGSIDFSPQFELHYGHMTFDAYEETGNTGHEKAIHIQDYKVMELGMGFRLSLPTEAGYSLRPELSMDGLLRHAKYRDTNTSLLFSRGRYLYDNRPRQRSTKTPDRLSSGC